METIKQQLNIPANRQVKLNVILSDETPVGAAEIIMVIVSHSQPPNNRHNIMELAGCLRHSKALRGDPVSIQKGLRNEW